ncbi:amidase [Fulvivirga sp. M361]|uniref:amidase n=1 Tax=Fulvivirga sp. M361 TaxID=2594266 RepID=UPI00117BA621|nr:amidase [Fulvivirga sp. M361]TRX62604.1 amidase [Fulvivirga sp. M361]
MKILTPVGLVVALTILSSCTNTTSKPGNIDSIAVMEPYFNLEYTASERDSLRENVWGRAALLRELHKYKLPNSTVPALDFNPRPAGFQLDNDQKALNFNLPSNVKLPEDQNALAFYTVAELSYLIRSEQISSVDLTRFFLERIKKYQDTLQCLVTLTEDLAIKQAERADKELAAGKYRGPLHGIPYGVKDLLALDGYKTTWGAMPYKDQELAGTATVIKKLEESGAVLVAKLTLGALAMGDIWYGGVTKNPWNIGQGSSGSSAGSASATAAGLVPFAIGTETWGSIVSPSTRCGTTGLRPTFGRVSRSGAMALSWSMDKIGPITRSARDAAMVFDVIKGKDGEDRTVVEAAFNFDATQDIKNLKVAYLKTLFDESGNKANDSLTLVHFEEMGVKMEAIELPSDIPVMALSMILAGEASAAFDNLTRSNKDDLLVNQKKSAWPNYFRSSRFLSATDYVNANRIRYELILRVNELFQEYDAIVCPSYGGNQLLMTNLTGHPCVVLPNGFNEKGSPTSFSIIGNLYKEGNLLELAHTYQEATDIDEKHPEMFMN